MGVTKPKSKKQRRFERRLAERRDHEYTLLVGKIARGGLKEGSTKHAESINRDT